MWFYFVPGRGVKQLWSACLLVCLSVCPLTYLKNRASEFYQIICSCYLWLWLADLLRQQFNMLYTSGILWMTSRFYILERMGQNQKRCVCFVHFVRWRHLRRSLPYQTACCFCMRPLMPPKTNFVYRLVYVRCPYDYTFSNVTGHGFGRWKQLMEKGGSVD